MNFIVRLSWATILLLLFNYAAYAKNFLQVENLPIKEKIRSTLVVGPINDQSFNQSLDLPLFERVGPLSELLVDNLPKTFSPSGDRSIELTKPMQANKAHLRVIDKIYGTVHKIDVLKYREFEFRSLKIELTDCFYDTNSLRNESIAFLKIFDSTTGVEIYKGWMSSSNSHLTNYSNYRYSLWLLSCIISVHE
jgi:hypothetical protein